MNNNFLSWLIKGLKGKTSWNYLEMIVIPLFLAITIGIINYRMNEKQVEIQKFINNSQLEIQRNIRNQASLEKYLEEIGKLITVCRSNESCNYESNQSNLVRAWTITISRILDSTEKVLVLNYLYESKLIGFDRPNIEKKIIFDSFDKDPPEYIQCKEPIVLLNKTNFEKINIQNINLTCISLLEVNLTKSNFSNSNLSGAFLYKANLKESNFLNSNLSGVFFYKADLRGANFSESNLTKSNFSGYEETLTLLLKLSLPSDDSLRDFHDFYNYLHDSNNRYFNHFTTLKILYLSELSSNSLSYKPDPLKTKLKGANFTKANLRDVNFKGVDLEGTYLYQVQHLNNKQLKLAKNWDKAIYTKGKFNQKKLQWFAINSKANEKKIREIKAMKDEDKTINF